jgi:hypothetical protein
MSEEDASWIVVPVVLSLLIYASFALFLFPYARPIFSLWIIVFAVFFPPMLFVLSIYLLALACVATPPAPVETVVVVRDPVPIVERQGRVRVASRNSI